MSEAESKIGWLDVLSKTICDSYVVDTVRSEAVSDYADQFRAMEEDWSEVTEMTGLYSEHLDSFLNVIADPSESPLLRTFVLNLAVTTPFKKFARIDKHIKEASSIKLSFNPGWPDFASTLREKFDFEQILESVIKVAEDPKATDSLREYATLCFNHVYNTSSKVLDQPIDREPFNTRFLMIAMQSKNSLLRQTALNLGYK